jgi:predicted MFS family arabinose efflux permease
MKEDPALQPPSPGSFFALLGSRDFRLLFIAHLFFGMAFWSYVLFPAHLQSMGADPLQIGILMGAASLSGVLVRSWIGHVIDRNGRRRCLVIGGTAFLVTQLLYLFLPHLGWELFAVRLLHGIGTGTLLATLFTLAADLSPPAQRIGGIALFGVSGQFSGTIGVPLAEAVIAAFGFPALFVLSAVFSGISLFLCLLIPETLKEKEDLPSEPFSKLVFNPALRPLLLTTFAFSLGVTSYIIFIKPYAASVGIARVDSFFLTYTLMAIGIRVMGGAWPNRYGEKTVLAGALFSLVFGIILLAFIPSAAWLPVSGFLCGLGHGLVLPILSSMVIRQGGEASRGGSMTLYTLVFDLGILVGSPFFGWIVKTFQYTALYMTGAGVVLLGIVALFQFNPPSRERKGV